MSTRTKESPRKQRIKRRGIDRLRRRGSDGEVEIVVEALERHGDAIWKRCSRLYAGALVAPWTGLSVGELPNVEFSGAEAAAIGCIIAFLIGEDDTDSRRRIMRDAQIAEDFIFHKEVLGHQTVMISVCQRWGLSESAVKQAVRNHGDVARRQLAAERATYDPKNELTKSILEHANGPSFENYMSLVIRNNADMYRLGEAKELRPRERKPRKGSKGGVH